MRERGRPGPALPARPAGASRDLPIQRINIPTCLTMPKNPTYMSGRGRARVGAAGKRRRHVDFYNNRQKGRGQNSDLSPRGSIHISRILHGSPTTILTRVMPMGAQGDAGSDVVWRNQRATINEVFLCVRDTPRPNPLP